VRPASETRRLDEFPIPLYAVATNLETGQIAVLHEVPLWIAMRSSMSIPGVFAPAEVDGRILGDGGLVRNLPVEIARQHGAEVIIAVNVGTPLLPRESLSSALGVAQQMINILTEQNVEISLKALGPKDILVSPDLKGVTFLDFERGAELIARGEAAARAVLPALAKLAVTERAYEAWEFARTRQPVYWDRAIEDIRVVGTKRSNPEALVREVERLGIAKGQTVNDDQLVRAARVISGLGDYERVDVHAEIEGADQDPRARKFVVIDVDEKPWGPDYLRIGGRAVADFQTDARFSITLQHTRAWLNDWGAEWRNEVSIGDVRRFATSAYQPLGPGSAWFLEGMLQAVRSDFDIYAVSTGLTSRRTDRVTRSLSGAYATVGRRFGTAAVARLMFGHERYGTRPLVGTTAVAARDEGKLVLLDATYDTLDDANFPRYGFLGTAALTSISYASGGDPVEGSILQALLPITFGRLTLLALASGAYSRDDRGQFTLGGLFSLSGTPIGRVSGSQVVGLSALAYYRVGDLPRTLGRGWYVGGSIEAGNAWAHRSDVSTRDVHKAGSVFVGFDTIIGPLYLAAGKTLHGQSALYLFLGRPTDRN
jgi:NTE family protein